MQHAVISLGSYTVRLIYIHNIARRLERIDVYRLVTLAVWSGHVSPHTHTSNKYSPSIATLRVLQGDPGVEAGRRVAELGRTFTRREVIMTRVIGEPDAARNRPPHRPGW